MWPNCRRCPPPKPEHFNGTRGCNDQDLGIAYEVIDGWQLHYKVYGKQCENITTTRFGTWMGYEL